MTSAKHSSAPPRPRRKPAQVQPPAPRRLRAIDLCCGAGGWACAARGMPIDWILVADKAADCLETWQLNHAGLNPNCGLLCEDLATEDNATALISAAAGVDLIVGAIPCEQVSMARGNRALKEGELAELHVLIDGLFAIVKALRPRWWIFEDVAAIVPHLPLPLFDGLPYEIAQIDAADYGPQKRTRVFIGSFRSQLRLSQVLARSVKCCGQAPIERCRSWPSTSARAASGTAATKCAFRTLRSRAARLSAARAATAAGRSARA